MPSKAFMQGTGFLYLFRTGCPDVFASRSAFWSQYPDSLLVANCAGGNGASESTLPPVTERAETLYGQQLIAYPNPTEAEINLRGIFDTKLSGSATVSILNVNGRQIMERVVAVQAGRFTEQIDCSDFARGLHLVVARFNGEMLQRKIIVE